MRANLNSMRGRAGISLGEARAGLLGSLLRIRLVTGALLRQNRVLVGLLLVWPCVLAGILAAVDHGSPSGDDVAAVLQQELFYGLVLVGLGASVGLGTEMRARRVHQVLGRAVGRTEYLLALGAASFLPFVGYMLVWLATAAAFAGLLHQRPEMLASALLAESAAGFLVCTVGLLCSVLLPQLLAAVATGAVLSAFLAAARFGWGGAARLFSAAIGGLNAVNALWLGAGEAVLAAAALLGAAALVFSRKDLRLV